MNSLPLLFPTNKYVDRVKAVIFCLAGFSTLAMPPMSAQPAMPSAVAETQSATVSGRVRNESTGAYLEGAEVLLEGTQARTFTLADGSFVLRRVPAGAHTLAVTYSGLDIFKVRIVAGATESTNMDIGLKDSVHVLGAITVTGQREGNAASINRQKSAENIVNVIATDAYGNVADGNIGNFLQRLPGVSVVTSEGEVIGIGLRGIPPDQSSVSVDGAIMAAAVAGAHAGVLGDRAPPIDRLPPDFIKEIEVLKASTPDRPANGLGGSANLRTKSAFDFNQSVTTYRLGMNNNLYRDTPFRPTGSITHMNTLGSERKVGIALSASYHRAIGSRDRFQGQRTSAQGHNTQFRLLNDIYDRIRWGYSAKLEYKLTPDTLIGFDLSYSSYTSDFVRYDVQAAATASARIADYNVVSRQQIEAGAVPRTSTNQTAGVAPGPTHTFTELLNANWSNQSSVASRSGDGYKFGTNLSTVIAGFDVKARASYNPEQYDRDFIGVTSTLAGVGVAIDSTELDRPMIRQTYGPSLFADTDFSRYTAQYFRGPDRTKEEIAVGQLDAEREFGTRIPFTLKTGVMWSEQHRTATTWRPTWSFVGADGVAGLNTATGMNDDGLPGLREPGLGYGLFDGLYPQFQHLDYGRVEELFQSTPGWFRPVGTSVSTRAPATELTETVSAAYVMGKVRVRSLQIVGGVRAEHTSVDAIGVLNDPQNPGTQTFRSKKSYQSAFPSIHFRYAYRPDLLLRASYSTSMARPSIGQLIPNTTINYEAESISQGNSGLKPQYSQNYDLSLEYYLEPAGVLSVSAYHKEIEDYILNSSVIVGDGPNNGFDGNFAGFLLNTTSNAGGAKVTGGEINYTQSLNFLPSPWSGLSLSANYTKLKSEGTYSGGATVLRNYIPWTANFAVSYTWRRFEGRVAARSQASYLLSFNADPLARQYSDKDKTVDINLQYAIRPWLKLYADVINVFNHTPDVYTANDRTRLIISEYYGTKLNVGISGRF